MTSRNQPPTSAGDARDLHAMLSASFARDGAPLPGMLARAMVYNQDAERKLEHARSMKQEAAKYRDQVQRQTVEQTEAFCAEVRTKVEEEYDAARKMRSDAEAAYEAARAEIERAATIRADADSHADAVRAEAGAHADAMRAKADSYADAVRTEADEYRRSAEAQAAEATTAITEQAQLDAAAAVAEHRERVEDELRSGLHAVENMQSAVQAELEAQQMYTEALRFRTASPTWIEPAPVPPPSTRIPKGRRTARKRAA